VLPLLAVNSKPEPKVDSLPLLGRLDPVTFLGRGGERGFGGGEEEGKQKTKTNKKKYCVKKMPFCNSMFWVADLKAQLNVRTAELSEARIKLDDVKRAQEREQQARDDLHASYQQRLKEKEAEIEAFKK
jgi:hypothetical protein